MRYKVIDLKREIRIALDENMTSSQLLESGDIDTLTLDEIIESKIVDAVRIIETEAPLHLLGVGKPFGTSIGWFDEEGRGGGYVLLPDDFMRLVSFQMSDWSRQVSTVITEDDPKYLQQKSRYPGVRGCPQKPVVAITSQPVGQYLEFYSCTGGDSVYLKRAQYIPIPHVTDGRIEISEKVKSAVVAYAAYLTAMSIGQSELAKDMLNHANELIK